MADPAEKHVAVVDGDGAFWTVPESQLDKLPDGARVLSRQEEAQQAEDERYDNMSGFDKATGALSTAVGVLSPLTLGAAPGSPPVASAVNQGVREGFTGGLLDAGVRKTIDATAGTAAGDRYAQQIDDRREASPIAYGAGNALGMVAGASLGGEFAGARALPSAGISSAGGALEQGVEHALGGLAKRGVLGRAASSAAATATRGALEGGITSVVEQGADDLLHNTPITGQKLYAAGVHGALLGAGIGGALGFTGSLAKSGLTAGRAKVADWLGGTEAGAAAAERRTPLLAEGGAVGARPVEPIAPEPTPHGPAAEPAPAGSHSSVKAVEDFTADQAWRAVGGGFHLQSTRYAKEAAKYFPGGTKDIGRVALKYNVIDTGAPTGSPLEAAMAGAKSGTPTEIAPKVATALDGVGRRIGEITDASGSRIHMSDVDRAIARVREPYDRIAGNEHVVSAVDGYQASLKSKLPVAPDGTVSLQDFLEQRKGLDAIVFRETKALDPGRRVTALRSVSGKMEDLITDAMDSASGKVPGELRAQYTTLKRDYHALRILNEAAEDSAARAAKGASFGLGEKFAVGQALATGHFAAAPILALGGKVLRERGNAAAAAYLSRSLERGQVQSVIDSFRSRVQRSAAGVLREAPEAASGARKATDGRAQAEQAKADVRETQAHGQAIIDAIAQIRGNPAKLTAQLQEASEIIGRSAGPQAAESYTATTLRAIAFVAGYVPVRERRDPLDPRSVPPLNYDEADRLVRAAKYASKPDTILDDFGRGKVTPEGLKAADLFIDPESMQEFRDELQSHAEARIRSGKSLTQSQRLRLDKLLKYPAGADLKGPAIVRLQANLTKKAPSGPNPADPASAGGKPPPAPVDLKVQQSGFDAIEARLAG